MINAYIKQILQARVYDVARKTPLETAHNLSQRLGNHILLKREDLQPVFSFKLRGAYNKIASLPIEILQRGIITASAGNHAQGVALSAQRLGIQAQIIMPKTTPETKINAVRHWGGKAILHGNTYDDAGQYARQLADDAQLAFIHPYDDPQVIAGQGTIAMEILHQHSGALAAIFVPVGGGGLIAGIAAYVKYVRPDIKIIGVEPQDAPTLYAALHAHERVILDQVGIFADGVAVRQIGAIPFEIARQYVDEVLLVSTDEICAAIKDIFEDTRVIAEPAGALALAGLKQYIARENVRDLHFATIVSGANTSFDRLQFIAERTELGANREALMAVTIPERPGSFRTFCHSLGQRALTEFNYRYADKGEAQVLVGVRLGEGGNSEKEKLLQKLRDKDYPVLDLSGNELAKLHVRHMVGGHCPGLKDERIYRFEFPERPGALLHFLSGIGERWNISLFHYRNHGSAYGRVLMGIQVADAELTEFTTFLEGFGYSCSAENENPAYRFFLA
jgi:threonine dehydratase